MVKTRGRHAFLLFTIFLVPVCFGFQNYEYVRIPTKLLTQEFVERTQFIRDHYKDKRYAVGYLSIGARLTKDERAQMVPLDEAQWRHQNFDIETLTPLATPIVRNVVAEPYHTYTTLTAELKDIAERYPDLVSLQSAGKSVQGRELWYLRISSKSVNASSKPKLLYISSMHGDEVVGKELMVYLVREILKRYDSNPRVRALVDYADIFIMPSMNPDGTELHQRWNAKGVDLNRNFPRMDEDEFSLEGRAVETRVVMELHRQHHFLLALNFHGGTLCVNIPWDHKPNPKNDLFGDDTLIATLAQEYATLNKPMHSVTFGSFKNGVTYGYEWYLILGGMQDWTIHFRQSTHATAELSNIKWPTAETLPGFWGDNREALLSFLEKGLHGFHLKVTNDAGELLPVQVDVSSAWRTLSFQGYVHRLTVPGLQTVTLKSASYKTRALSLAPEYFQGQFQTVVMEKN